MIRKIVRYIGNKMRTNEETRKWCMSCTCQNDCDICRRVITGEYVFVQYYDAVSHNDIPVNAMEKNLRRIRLIWDWYGDD